MDITSDLLRIHSESIFKKYPPMANEETRRYSVYRLGPIRIGISRYSNNDLICFHFGCKNPWGKKHCLISPYFFDLTFYPDDRSIKCVRRFLK